MKLRAAGKTDKGLLSSHNEDHFLARGELGLFVVADGVGGLEAGEVASSLACCTMEEAVCRAAGTERARRDEVLREAVARCNKAVMAVGMGRDDRRGIGSTLVALWLQGDRALFASVGDSRLYLFRDGSLRQLTRDAKAGRFRLAASLGQERSVKPQMGMVRLRPADRFLLSTDGLHGVVRAGELCRLLDEEDDCARCSEQLVRAGNEAGGPDNVTAVVVDVVEPDPPQAWRFSRVRRDATSALPKLARLGAAAVLTAAAVVGVGFGFYALGKRRPPRRRAEPVVPAPVGLAAKSANELAAAGDAAGTREALKRLVRAAIREKAVVRREELPLSPEAARLLPAAAKAVWDELYAPARRHLASVAGTPAERYVARELEVTRERVGLVREQFLGGDYRHVGETFATLAEEAGTIAQRGWREFREDRAAVSRELEALRRKGKAFPPDNPVGRRLVALVAEAGRALESGDLPRARRSMDAAQRVLRGEVEPR